MPDIDLATILADGEYLRRVGDTLDGGTPGGTAEDAVDAVADALVEGVGIDIVYDDTANTITLSATAVAGRRTVKIDTSTAYAPILTDESQMVTLSNAAAITVTLPQDSTLNFALGAKVDFLWLGVGQPTFAAGTGATVHATPGPKLRARYSAATAKKISTNTWVVIGDLSS